jgi:hypothetical protein
VHLLSPSFVVLVSGGLLLPVWFFVVCFVVLRGFFLLLLLFGFVVGCRLCLFVFCVSWVRAVWLALSRFRTFASVLPLHK